MKKLFLKPNKGFTLVEMLVAVGVFVLVTALSLGAILSIFDANRKAKTSKTVVDNLNLSIENMARTIRYGSNYYCGESLVSTEENDCLNGSTAVSVTFENSRIIYRLNGTTLQRVEGGQVNNITSPDTKIEHLRFYVDGANEFPNTKQPYIVVVIKGYVGEKANTKTEFSIETMMSQRKIDL